MQCTYNLNLIGSPKFYVTMLTGTNYFRAFMDGISVFPKTSRFHHLLLCLRVGGCLKMPSVIDKLQGTESSSSSQHGALLTSCL